MFNADYILIPSSGYESVSMCFILVAREKGIVSVLLVDNWDNLSSKSILWEKPDYLGTWGQQSTEHAIRIQSMTDVACFEIGTPRIDKYFHLDHSKIPRLYEEKYILFLGSSVPYNEAQFVALADELIASHNQSKTSPLKLIYRPHPLRGGWDLPDFSRLVSTVLDRDLIQIVESGEIRWNRRVRLPNLTNYPSLISNCEFVVSGLTSMLIESSIFNKKCIALAIDEPMNITSPLALLREYEHFSGIENIPGLQLVSSVLEFQEAFLAAILLSADSIVNGKTLEHFIYHDEFSYAERLKNKIEEIEKKTTKAFE
jgi:hypothetical protein